MTLQESRIAKDKVEKPDFDLIRSQLREIVKIYGGKINIEEWVFNGDDCLRAVLTWKSSRALEAKIK